MSWLRDIFTGKADTNGHSSFDTSYHAFQIGLNKELNKNKQIFEDMHVASNIKREAFDMYSQWANAPVHVIDGKEYRGCIIVRNPCRSAYFIYDDETAKYKDVNIGELVKEEFERLKKELGDL